MKKLIASLLMSLSTAALADAPKLGSQAAIVVDDRTGQVLMEKNANSVVPIASLTKLMTAMVVLDARQDMDEKIAIEWRDVDVLKHSTSRVPVGAKISRREVLQLALMSSDNRAAAALGRTYPGGMVAFKAAVRAKSRALGMNQTWIEEPTGLSPHNKSTAVDLAKMAAAASHYPEIARMSTDSSELINVSGRNVEYRNTNRLVGAKGWDIGLSKTGYTEEAGRCLIMKITAAGRDATLVLLNAKASSVRIMDALRIRKLLGGEPERLSPAPRLVKAKASGPRVSARSGSSKKVMLRQRARTQAVSTRGARAKQSKAVQRNRGARVIKASAQAPAKAKAQRERA
jgi:D-alanyl-D-alanine carboxypeptidase/D-alanyl-D-alanine endopeptidase (penicillin-binding protein 7)